MRLGDVGGLRKSLPRDGVENDPIWERGADQLTDNEIQLFYARSGLKGLRQAAVDAIDHAQAVVVRALFCGELAKGSFAALVLHETPPDPFMADEFVDGLVKLPHSRRSACVFTLECRQEPAQTADLLWNDVSRKGLSPTALDVLRVAELKRNARLPYVFWEWATADIASSLLGLRESIETAFGCNFAQLQDRYNRMVMIDRRAESASFLELAKQLKR